jgi:hypothetical protein
MAKEQERIEQELLDFEKGLFGNTAKADSIASDSSAVKPADVEEPAKDKKKKKKARTRRQRVSRGSGDTPTTSSGAAPRVSVRRQRH